MTFRDLVSASWLAGHLGDPGLVVVDASVGAFRGADGIPGALRFDLDGAMSRHDSAGVHDMLEPTEFEQRLRELGIRDGDRVVAYDAQGIFSSARAWWMLQAAGLEAAVLDGGLPEWVAAGGATEPTRERADQPGDVTVRWHDDAFVDADVVARAIASDEAVVLDARSFDRFAGIAPEPRSGLRGGHIPGSVSLPFAALECDGRLQEVGCLADRIDEAAGDAPIITTCGSGVTACVVALAATLAGRDDVRVYDGSWSDWGRTDSGRPVDVGD
jgi:thiosulfate/3-mercaptopyruvate sulfurtransferase